MVILTCSVDMKPPGNSSTAGATQSSSSSPSDLRPVSRLRAQKQVQAEIFLFFYVVYFTSSYSRWRNFLVSKY